MRKEIALSRPFILPFLLALKLVIDNNLVLFFIKFFFFLFLDSQDPGSFVGFMTLQRSYIAASIAKMSSLVLIWIIIFICEKYLKTRNLEARHT